MRSSDWEPRYSQSAASALYVHVPFCARKCAYCDFASWQTHRDDPLMGAYVDGVLRLLEEAADAGIVDGLETAYVGGGTPSLIGPDLLVRLVGQISALGVVELSCEANPESLSDEVIAACVESGATRLSIGVQSLSDEELVELGRLHDAATAENRVRAAVESGLDVSCDLMCAIPRQSEASWTNALRSVCSLGVSHVSVYPLSIEEGTALSSRYAEVPCEWNSSEVEASRMIKAREVLEGFGYSRYEVASYALPGKMCKHNRSYWTGVSYLGLGTNASSMLSLEGYLRLCKLCPQLPQAPRDARRVRLTMTSDRSEVSSSRSLADVSFSLEFLTLEQAVAEDLMLGARLAEGLDPGLVAFAREALPSGSVDRCLSELIGRGFLKVLSGRFAPTDDGWLLGNELYGELWDLAPGEVVEAYAR